MRGSVKCTLFSLRSKCALNQMVTVSIISDICIYNIYDMENRILACHLTCIICRGLSHEKWKFKLYMSLDGHFYYVYVFDGQNGLWRAWHLSNSCLTWDHDALWAQKELAVSVHGHRASPHPGGPFVLFVWRCSRFTFLYIWRCSRVSFSYIAHDSVHVLGSSLNRFAKPVQWFSYSA